MSTVSFFGHLKFLIKFVFFHLKKKNFPYSLAFFTFNHFVKTAMNTWKIINLIYIHGNSNETTYGISFFTLIISPKTKGRQIAEEDVDW